MHCNDGQFCWHDDGKCSCNCLECTKAEEAFEARIDAGIDDAK